MGSLQGDSLSLFPFTLFLKPLLQWLYVDSRGYALHCMRDNTHPNRRTYPGHCFANDTYLTTSIIADMKLQLTKPSEFSKYTQVSAETSECKAT